MSKIIQVDSTGYQHKLVFDDGSVLYSDHEPDCCESHFLSLKDLSLKDFEDLSFDLTSDDFFERVDGFGIRLKPTNGHPVSIPGYGFNNGYYSQDLTLILDTKEGQRMFDITECQNVKD